MSCRHNAEALLIDSELTDTSRAELEAHVRECPECSVIVKSIRSARAAGQQVVTPEATAEMRERVWANVGRPRLFGWQPAAVALAAAAVVAAFFTVRPSPTETPPPKPADAIAVTVRDGDVRRTPAGAAKLGAGWVEIAVGPTTDPIRAVETPDAVFFGSSARFVVTADDAGTLVRVVAGRVRVESLDGTPVRWVEAGHAAQIPSLRPAEERPEPAPRPPTKPAPARRTVVAPKKDPIGPAAPGDAPRAPPPPVVEDTPTPPIRNLDHERRVRDARRAVVDDPRGASRIALALIEEAPAPVVEVSAMAVVADAYRRDGRANDAADWYQRVVRHPAGRAYVEEASLRRAELLLGLGRIDEALRALDVPSPTSTLLPERLAVRARAQTAAGDRSKATEAYDAAIAAARAAGDDALAETLKNQRDAL